ncbi:MAG: hypothetical protein AAB424_01580 [Patescibacteria group bacterium]|mgnify:FL=1
MKSHAPKPLRSTSKARAWYGFALVFGIGILLLPGLAKAALTSPVPVVTGSGYGKADSLGLRQETIIGEDGKAFTYGQSWNRRIVYMEPPGGKKLLVAAVVNTSDTISGCSGTKPKCRLEFRVSENNGLTWSQALLGPKLYLEIVGPKFDYTIYPDPNGNDLWVSYTDSVLTSTYSVYGVVNEQDFTNSKIQKLTLDSTTKLAWALGASERPNYTLSNTGVTFTDYVSPTAVGIQVTGSISRVWAAISAVTTNADPYVVTRDAFLVYKNTSTFGDNNPWILSYYYSRNNLFATNPPTPGYTKYASEFGASAKISFLPLGANKQPLIVMNIARRNVDCKTLEEGFLPLAQVRGLRFLVPSNGDGDYSTWNPIMVSASYPFYYKSTVNGTDCLPSTPVDPVRDLITTSGGEYRFDFSAAAMPVTGNANKGRVVLAYEGGVDTNGGDHTDEIRVATCDVTIDGSFEAADVSCPIIDKQIATGFGSPSVGFYEGVPWVAYSHHVNTTQSKLHFSKETLYNTPSTWDWAEQAGVSYATNTIMPSVPAYIPSASAVTTNSGYIPTIWSEKNGKRIAFAANTGGALIGTNPPYTSNPIWGYGWSSNFGWLSLNCINKPNQDCTNLFGTGIGTTPHGDELPVAGELAQLQNVAGLSPTSDKTFPIGGYAWSSNAGFLSLERRDSICSAANCPSPNSNPNGNPPGLAYNNYAPSGAVDPNVPIAKYDTASQHVYGWGRFLNLCNYDSLNKRCKDKDNGWVRLRGYYKIEANNAALGTNYNAGTTTLTLVVNGGNAFYSSGTNAGVATIGAENFTYTRSGDVLTITPSLQQNYAAGTLAYNVTGNEYGLDAFWTGDHYELAGWAWSNDYGWIRFNPLIFVGFSWLETLFGNVYSGGDIAVPSPKNLSKVRHKTCGVNGNEDCYVGTYRIEAGGSIAGFSYAGTGDLVDPADSAGGSILKPGVSPTTHTCDPSNNPTKTYAPEYCVLQGDNTVLNPLLERSWATPAAPPFGFPTVGSTTTSYRNALGKLDVGGLTKIIGTAKEYTGKINSRTFLTKPNRFGNTVYKTSSATSVPTWTINELSGWVNQTWDSEVPVFPLNVTTAEAGSQIAPLRSQVVHVQGNLTVDGKEATYVNNVGDFTTGTATLTVSGISSPETFPTQATVGSKTVGCAGCAIVIDQGQDTEEYFSYTEYNINTKVFSGVRRLITCAGTTMCKTHTANVSKVRWVWRLPYGDNGTTNTAQSTTIVVDGNLEINYNIIAADRTKDADISATTQTNPAPDTIRDLPTIAFVVKGNVIIDPQVNKLTGAFIVTSRNTTPDPDSVVSGTIMPNPDSKCTSQYLGCGGVFKTGNDNISSICTSASPKCRPLTITGLLFARRFAFERIGSLQKNDTPAERVIADERLFLNPPPGLADVTKALPNPTRTLP